MKKIIILACLLIITVILNITLLKRRTPDNFGYIKISSDGDIAHYISKSDNDKRQKAIEASDPELCKNIREKESSYYLNQYNSCIEKIARKLKSTDICKKYFKDQSHINGCIWWIANDSLDESICDQIQNDNSGRINCYDTIMRGKARTTGDLNFCLRQISPDVRGKYRCIQMHAKDKIQCEEYMNKITPKDTETYEYFFRNCPER